jgi:Divergent polysaccharide deacetylase
VVPTDDNAGSAVQSIQAAGKTAVVDGSVGSPARIASLIRDGARGVIASLDGQRARALLRGIDRNALVVDAALSEDDAVGAAAKALHRQLYTRDVIADARDDGAYVDFMLRDALAIAQRTGTAIVTVHARAQSFDAISRFADRANRDGADIVALTDLNR